MRKVMIQMHRIRSGEHTIEVVVPAKPERGGIDPNYLMIDLTLEDNVMLISRVGGQLILVNQTRNNKNLLASTLVYLKKKPKDSSDLYEIILGSCRV